jgi:hypothetical protein
MKHCIYTLTAGLVIGLAYLPSASAGVPYHIAFSGTRHLYTGYDSYLTFSPVATVQRHLIFNSVILPPGFSYEIVCTWAPCWSLPDGRKFQWQGGGTVGQTLVLHLRTTQYVSPGQYTIVLNTEMDGVKVTSPLSVVVSAIPLMSFAQQLRGPGVLGKSKWETTMVTLGAKWCNPTEVYSFADESTVWFYDGARVYFQIADYTRDIKWQACALNIARQYRDYVLKANGRLPGWRLHPHGLLMAWKRTGDASYRTALDLLARNGNYAATGGGIHFTMMRETAYVLQGYVAAEKAGFPRNPLMLRAATQLIGQFAELFLPAFTINKPFGPHLTVMNGLGAAALIEYYELTGDPRVPPTIKAMLDWMWTNAWSPTMRKLMINPDLFGPLCSWGCRQYDSTLVNLTAPAFAWYWQLTSDPNYLWKGDEMFAHALDTDINWGGKIFSQNYRWSFDYIRWRETVR